MRNILFASLFFGLGGCGTSWPKDYFPPELEIQDTLYSDDQFGGREGCTSTVVLLTQHSASRLPNALDLASQNWKRTPYSRSDAHMDPLTRIGRCDHESNSPPGDFHGLLLRPGAYYRVLNDGEGIAIIAPKARMAGFFYAG